MSFVFVVAFFAASLLEKTALHFNATKTALPPKNVAISRGVRWRLDVSQNVSITVHTLTMLY